MIRVVYLLGNADNGFVGFGLLPLLKGNAMKKFSIIIVLIFVLSGVIAAQVDESRLIDSIGNNKFLSIRHDVPCFLCSRLMQTEDYPL